MFFEVCCEINKNDLTATSDIIYFWNLNSFISLLYKHRSNYSCKNHYILKTMRMQATGYFSSRGRNRFNQFDVWKEGGVGRKCLRLRLLSSSASSSLSGSMSSAWVIQSKYPFRSSSSCCFSRSFWKSPRALAFSLSLENSLGLQNHTWTHTTHTNTHSA